MQGLASDIQETKNVLNPLAIYDEDSLGIRPNEIGIANYAKARVRKNFWENTFGATIGGIKRALASTPQLFGNVTRYVAGLVETAGPLHPETIMGELIAQRHYGKEDYSKYKEAQKEVFATLDKAGKAFSEKNKKWVIENLGMPQNKVEQFFQDIGAGGVSLGGALTLGAFAGGLPVLMAFGLAEAGDKYSELKDAGIPIDKSTAGSSLSGLFEGGIEAASTMLVLSSVKVGWFGRGLLGAGVEALEEFFQSASSDTISLAFGSKKYEGIKTIKEVLATAGYSGVIGFIVGGPGGISVSLAQRNRLARMYEVAGEVDPKGKANEVLKNMTEDAIADIEKTILGKLTKQGNVLRKAYAGKELNVEEKTVLDDMYSEYQKAGFIEEKAETTEEKVVAIDKANIEHSKRQPNVPDLEPKAKPVAKEVVSAKERLIKEGRLAKLDEEIKNITEQMRILEKQKTKVKSLGKSTKAIDTKLKVLQTKYDYVNSQRAEILLGEPTLAKERIVVRAKDIIKSAKEGRRLAINEVKAVRKELASLIRESKMPKALKDKAINKLTSKIATQADMDKKVDKIMADIKDSLAKYEESLARKVAIKKITKKYKKPQTIIDVEYQNKIDVIKAKLGGTKTKIRKSVKSMSTSELVELANTIAQYTETGKKVFKSKQEQKQMASEIMRAALIKEAGGIKELPPVGTREHKKKVDAGLFTKAKLAVMRPIRLIRRIFGSAGEMIIYNSVDAAETLKQYSQLQRVSAVKDSWKKNKITRFTLGKGITINGITLQLNDILRIYLASKDVHSKEAIIFGNKINEETFNKFIAEAQEKHPNYIKFADDVQKIVSEQYDRIAEVMKDIYNLPLSKVKVYFPLYRMYLGEEQPDFLKSIWSDFLMEETSRRTGVDYSTISKDFTITRQDIDEHNQKPVSLDFIGDAHRIIESQEHFIHFASLQKMFNSLKKDNVLRKAVESNYNTAAWDTFNSYIKDVVNPKMMYQDLNFVGTVLKRTRKALGTAYLGFNVVTGLKQLPSLMLALRYTNLPRIMGSLTKVLVSKKAREEIYVAEPSLRNRVVTRDLGDFMANNTELADNDLIRALSVAQDAIGKSAFSIIMNMDKFAVLAVYDSVYNHQKQIVSEQEARNLASKAVIETQPQGAMKDLPQLYRTNNEFLRMTLMFTNQLNQILNMAAFDVGADIKGKKYFKAANTLASIMVSSFFIYLVSHGFKFPEDEEEQLGAFFDAIFGSFVSSIPILGNLGMSLVRGYSPSISPLEGVIDSMKWNISKFKNEQYAKAMTDSMINALILSGVKIPYSQIRRTIKGIIDIADYESEDYRRLIWSKSALHE